MRFVNYSHKESKEIGVQLSIGGAIVPLTRAIHNNAPLFLSRDFKDMIEVINYFTDERIEKLKKDINNHLESSIPYDEVKILAPIKYPARNIFCLGKNYREHALEMKGKTTDEVVIPKKPIYFSKMCYPAIGHGDKIKGHVGVSEQVDYEVELAVIIKKGGKDIKKEDVKDHIFGYTIVNDISARDLQVDHIQWYRAKSLDGFCPMGPAIVHKSAVSYPPMLKIKSYVNNELRQDGVTSDLIFSIDHIVSELSKGITLIPGDIIITGTPSGVGMGFNPPKYLKSGDVITCEIESIGKLRNLFE